ncbi:reverse transcriptase (RNA-dependent DNA polymerase) [Hirsutella rhossiliensis]
MKRFEELVRAGATALPRLAVEPRGLRGWPRRCLAYSKRRPTQRADGPGRTREAPHGGTIKRSRLPGGSCAGRGAGPRRTLDCSVTLADAACACTSTGNTSPGIDGITVRMLRRVWNHIGEAGAFDTVLRNRLLLRLREQGWPTNLVRWGSPASPILFLLYTVPIYSIGEPNSRFGYADDVATLIRGRSLQETAARATRAAGELIQWGADNGVVFDPGKTEVIHFTRPRYKGDLPSVWHGSVERSHSRTCAGSASVPSRITYLKNRIQLTLNVAMRAIAPVWCTMPIVALHRETGIPPATLLLADAQRRAASEDGACGYGYSVWLGPSEVTYGSGRVLLAEVYDAEVEGALEGLRAALTWSPRTPDQQWPIVVCLDNTAAIRAIRGSPSISSQAAAEKFAEAAARHGDVSTRWCPGHTGIAGNERADQLAKEGCRAEGPDRPPTYANIKRQAKAAARRDFQDWWAAGAPSSYKSLELKASLGCPPELHTKRQHLHHLLAARSGHGDFADYHERFNHEEARIECSCGRRKSPTHPFYCRKVDANQYYYYYYHLYGAWQEQLDQLMQKLDVSGEVALSSGPRAMFADVARALPNSPPSSTRSIPGPTKQQTANDSVHCTIDTSRAIEVEMRAKNGHETWRDEAELQLVKEAAQKTAVEGARIMRDQLYPVRVDNANRTAILDTEGNILPGAIEALSAENRVTIGKISWLSKRESGKAYGSMVVYVTKKSDAERLLDGDYFDLAGESATTYKFEPRTGPIQCFNCQEIGHKAYSCKKQRTCGKCANAGHHHRECTAIEPKCVPCGGPHESFSWKCRMRNPSSDA